MDNQQKRLSSSPSSREVGAEKTASPEDRLNAHRLKIKNDVESAEKTPRIIVRRVLAYLRTRIPITSHDANKGIGPLDIVPEEMWRKILSYISEPEDLVSSAGTCALFKSILEKRKYLKLFGRVLPFIEKHLKRKDILESRLVCKQWDKDICSFAASDDLQEPSDETVEIDLEVENYLQQFPSIVQTRVRNDPFVRYEVGLPINHDNSDDDGDDDDGDDDDGDDGDDDASDDDQDLLVFNTNPHLDEMKLHPGSPFIGGFVLISLNLHAFGPPRFCIEMRSFLIDFDQHLTCLILSSNCFDILDEYEDICSVIALIFKTCPKLKKFELEDIPDKFENDENICSETELNTLPDHPCIRYIDIYRRKCRNILYQLLMKYSNQLVLFEVRLWSAQLWQNFPFPNLAEIIFYSVGISQDITNALKRLNAPRLRHIEIEFTRDRTTLKNILEAINSFPRLISLCITLRHDITYEEILAVPLDIICRSSITSLRVNLTVFGNYFDLIMCFPFVNNLCLVLWKRINGSWLVLAEEWCLLLQAKNRARLAQQRGADVCMYKSNIWQVLPFLRTLKVHPGIRQSVKVYTREGYLGGGFDKVRRGL